ncbi:histidine phosphatase family protein [Myxococcota bacterium]|nr:histidine phosphatase family protein [Myxococcota bacterium]
MNPARTILTLVRHGETSANVDGVWHGSTDTRLTPLGERQARLVGRHARLNLADATIVYSSPLVRARVTARAIAEALDAPLKVDAELSEYDLGRWEGKTYRELQERHGLWDHMRRDPDFAPHGGESARQVTQRLERSLRRIARAHPGERVFVVTHGGALSLVLGSLLDGDLRKWRRVMDNCAVSELVLEPTPELLYFNATRHLVESSSTGEADSGQQTE